MPSVCSVINCAAKQQNKQTLLTFHRLPRNKVRQNTWLEILGKNNINYNHKHICVCSLHFSESSFNKTLEVIRLKDDAVPIYPDPLAVVRPAAEAAVTTPNSANLPAGVSTTVVLSSKSNSAVFDVTPGTLNEIPNYLLLAKIREQENKLQQYQKRFIRQNKKIRCLAEQVRRRNKRISELIQGVTYNTRERKLIKKNGLSKCSGPKDFLKDKLKRPNQVEVECASNRKLLFLYDTAEYCG